MLVHIFFASVYSTIIYIVYQIIDDVYAIICIMYETQSIIITARFVNECTINKIVINKIFIIDIN